MKVSSPGLSRFAKGVAFATLVLISLGGMVTSVGGGLSVPDWPTTFGYNMFTFPFSQWEGLVFWEHIHRLTGALVGLLTVILAVWILEKDDRLWVRWLGIGAVGLVMIQGVMGGLRVIDLSTPLAIVHGCVAQAFLCVVTLLAMALSPRWPMARSPGNSTVPPAFPRWAWALVAVVSIQLVLGAVMRHLGAGLAIPTFPLTPEGTLMPMVHNRMVDIAFAHRAWAAVVAVVAAVVIWKTIRLTLGRSELLGRYAVALSCMLVIQWTLGAWVIWFLRPPVPTTLHVLNGALMLMTAMALAVQVSRLNASQAERA